MTNEIALTLWPNVSGFSKSEMVLPWAEVPDLIRKAGHRKEKLDCPLIKFANFGDIREVPKKPGQIGSLRHDKNVLSVSGIEGDYDGEEISPDIAIERLQQHKIRAIVIPSYSSAPARPRWRVLAPLSRPVVPEERLRYAEVLNGILGGALARESFVLSQSFFIGWPIGVEPEILMPFDDIEEGYALDELNNGDELRRPFAGKTKATKEGNGGKTGDYLADLLAGEDIHGNALRLVGKLVRKGVPDDLIRMTFKGLADEVAQARGPERVAELTGDELERMISGARDKNFAPVDGPALLALAQGMTPDTDTEAIEDLIQQAASLPKLAKRRVWETVKRATGIPLGVLKEAENEGREGGEVVDQLSLAQGIRAAIGPENIIGQESGVWTYQPERGIWRPLEVREERQLVQAHLEEAKAEGRLDEVGKGLVDGVTDLLKSEVYRPAHQWDRGHDEAVSTPSGVLVLAEAGRWSLQPHRREDFRTVQVPVTWNPQAEAPRFKQFLAEVFAPDADGKAKAQALLEMMGYTLMAHARHEKFIILVGEGANGKSVLLSVLERLVGPENTAGVQPSQFDRGFQRAHLHLKLANIVTEVKQGETIADAELKGITSGEPSTVERKFQHPFTMRPFATCWFGTNHLPHTRDFSFALFRRALVVRFNRKFTPGVDADPQLKDKLFAELPGILRLCLEAYGEAVIFGQFTEPASCVEAKHEWRMEADQAAQFLAEQCREGGEIGSTDLFRAYLDWADTQGIKQRLSHKSFTDRVIRLGYGKAKRIQGIYFQNLHLTPSNEAHWEAYRRA